MVADNSPKVPKTKLREAPIMEAARANPANAAGSSVAARIVALLVL